MSNHVPTPEAESCSSAPARPTLEALPGRLSDLAGLPIRRLLPRSQRRLIGPWCFLDAYGPLAFASGKPMDVAPHPHIGLQTVSWLLDGQVLHHDSLGHSGLTQPGVLSLMTAGHGIAHSEETPAGPVGGLHGVQLWVALPETSRGVAPAFDQYHELPSLALEGGRATVLMGQCAGVHSPARVFSPLVAVDVAAHGSGVLVLPLEHDFEHALVVLHGSCVFAGQPLVHDTLYYLGRGRRELVLSLPAAGSAFEQRYRAGADRPPNPRATASDTVDGDTVRPTRLLLLGGAPFGESVLMWWNFVARSSDEIVAARQDWQAGRRFGAVAAYAGPRLLAPAFVARPVPR